MSKIRFVLNTHVSGTELYVGVSTGCLGQPRVTTEKSNTSNLLLFLHHPRPAPGKMGLPETSQITLLKRGRSGRPSSRKSTRED